MHKPIRDKLERMRFKYVYDTEEEIRGKKRGVKRGIAYTHGRHKGITVVYDGLGCPWIRDEPLSFEEMLDLDLIGPAKAYVPHIKDGFKYIRSHFPSFKIFRFPEL